MRMIRKIIVIHGLEYFIEFNIWNDKITGRHKFFINIRNNINNKRFVNIIYSCMDDDIRFDGIWIAHLNSKEAKRRVLNYFTNGYRQDY
jgi:hypothetical protein